jgi:hypothetical protein
MTRGHIAQINISKGGVPKLPVLAARVTALGLEGDGHNDTKHHGGPNAAVCLFSLEVIEQLRAEGHPIVPGSTGENVTVAGLDWPAIQPGVRLRFAGGVELEVMQYTTPCSTIRNSFTDLAFRRIKQEEHPGESRVYAKVLREGTDLRKRRRHGPLAAAADVIARLFGVPRDERGINCVCGVDLRWKRVPVERGLMLTPGWRLESTALIAALFSGAFQSGAWARQTHSYTGPPVPIPDGSAAGCGAAAIAEITVPQSGSYILQFLSQRGVYIPHQRQGDAVVSLQHVETGTTVTLIDRPGYPASPFGFTAANFGHPPPLGQFIASGYSSAAYETPLCGVACLDVSGFWGSATPLTVLVGENSAGTWRLLVSDCAAGSLGTHHSVHAEPAEPLVLLCQLRRQHGQSVFER